MERKWILLTLSCRRYDIPMNATAQDAVVSADRTARSKHVQTEVTVVQTSAICVLGVVTVYTRSGPRGGEDCVAHIADYYRLRFPFLQWDGLGGGAHLATAVGVGLHGQRAGWTALDVVASHSRPRT